MGCDIHMWAEIRQKHNKPEYEKEWKTVGNIFKSSYIREGVVSTYFTSGEPGDSDFYISESDKMFTDEPYEGRNYDLFAILADVRNGRGFAGVDTGEGFNPIAGPRGVPEDASDYYKHKVEEYGVDGHSHSYFTLEELEAYDWSQTTTHRGWVSAEQYKVFKAKGKPASWSGGVSGGMVEHVTNEKMDELLETQPDIVELEKEYNPERPHYYTQAEWEEPYSTSVRGFLEDTMPTLRELNNKDNVLELRIVFYFDN